MRGHFTVGRLSPADSPALFSRIELICRRAKLRRPPEICVLVGEGAMNAYALGGPDDAIITFTEGLLRGMTTEEVAAIFAHEIAHICNDDGWTMTWASSLQRAINDVSAAAANSVTDFRAGAPQAPLLWLLQSAPAVAELLILALSRFRELEADALALELTADPKTLADALAKLERHHRATSRIPAGHTEHYLLSYLRSHPLTSERISHLRASPIYSLACFA
jgi:heat shock protein HtpX